jgi:hypothetical protein
MDSKETPKKFNPLEWNDYIMRTQTVIQQRLYRMMRYADKNDLLLLQNRDKDEYMYYFEIPTHFIWRFDPVNFSSKIILRKPTVDKVLDLVETNQMDAEMMMLVFLGQENKYRLEF